MGRLPCVRVGRFVSVSQLFYQRHRGGGGAAVMVAVLRGGGVTLLGTGERRERAGRTGRPTTGPQSVKVHGAGARRELQAYPAEVQPSPAKLQLSPAELQLLGRAAEEEMQKRCPREILARGALIVGKGCTKNDFLNEKRVIVCNCR